MKRIPSSSYGIMLADGTCWNIVPERSEAASIVDRLACVMQLGSANGTSRQILVSTQNGGDPENTVLPLDNSQSSEFAELLVGALRDDDFLHPKKLISYCFHEEDDEDLEMLPLIQLSSIFALDSMMRGGILVHGALIERDGVGVVLAGVGGVGKTTACSRVPEPWRALSDDATLIVRDGSGYYWAHPWPTWSRFLVEKVGGSWEVERGIRLRAICFLSQSTTLGLNPLGEGEMACFLVETIEQASRSIIRDLDAVSSRKLWELYFRNICQIVKMVPGYRLELDLGSPFYTLIEDRILKKIE